jgi:hypothetical protein
MGQVYAEVPSMAKKEKAGKIAEVWHGLSRTA